MHLLAAVLISYAVGSIPAAYLAGRWKGIDLRRHGSGNLGATNVFRVLGAPIGLAVFAFDMAKGAAPVLLLPPLVTAGSLGFAGGDERTVSAIVCGIAAIMGHVRPLFLGFSRGGKGVATAGGVFMALAPVAALLTLGAFAIVVLASGFVSLGSLVAAALLPVLMAITLGTRSPLTWVAALVAAFVFWTHRANIGRLRRGEEHRFGKRNASTPATAILGVVAAVFALAVLVAARIA